MKKKIITICSSGSHYRQVIEYRDKLLSMGFKVLIPATALIMEKTGDYDINKHKVWFNDPKKYNVKTSKMKVHLSKIKKGDAILVTNFTKKGQKGYIGGNVLLEIFYAWILKKPIYLLNSPSPKVPLLEEVFGMNPIIINGDLSKIR